MITRGVDHGARFGCSDGELVSAAAAFEVDMIRAYELMPALDSGAIILPPSVRSSIFATITRGVDQAARFGCSHGVLISVTAAFDVDMIRILQTCLYSAGVGVFQSHSAVG
jgi:hypothetical protein